MNCTTGRDVVFGTKIEDFLCIRKVADQRRSHALSVKREQLVIDRGHFFERTDDTDGFVPLQQIDKRINVVFFSDGRKNEVKGRFKRFDRGLVALRDGLTLNTPRFFELFFGGGENCDVRVHCSRDLGCHVAKEIAQALHSFSSIRRPC